jgi:UDP-2,3-diacylglucosamine pyrophosphatase LpxH
MLVLFSDVHLTDGTSGATITHEAFDRFADHVADLARKRRAGEVRVVLLGDGMDVIRSSRWLDGPEEARPWRRPSGDQQRLTLRVLRATIEANREAVAYLRRLPRRVAACTGLAPDRVRLDYCLGNHDWIINRYRAARQVVAGALDLPSRYVRTGFPAAYTSGPDGYDVVARHGDVYDRLNYDAASGRDAASLGDALVVEVLNRFPLEVERRLAGRPGAEAVARLLRELDNVRPYTVMPAWLRDVIRSVGAGREDLAQTARAALARCLEDFRRSPSLAALVRRQLSWVERFYMRALLRQASRRGAGVLDGWVRLVDRAIRAWESARSVPGSRYSACALGERRPDGSLPRFVVYGHTHRVESVPLGPHPSGGDRFYLNTGTWRPVWERARTADGSSHFASWKEMSYVVLYAPGEGRGTHEFEIWRGSLRDRDARAAGPPRPAAPAVPAGHAGPRRDAVAMP